MIKKSIFLFAFLCSVSAFGQAKYFTKKAKITFDATTPTSPEKIRGMNQNAISVASYAAAASGLPSTAFKVNTTYLGGGLGRKIEQDYVSQAVQVALAVKKPVKLTWTREEDFTQDQYRPYAKINLKAKYELGNIKAWYCRTVTPSITAQRRAMAATAIDSQAVECLKSLPYKLGTSVVEWVPLPAGIPIGYWRSVGASMNVFAVESFIDELAKVTGNQDPFQFRYNLLNDLPDDRARKVLQAVDTLSSWRLSLPTAAWQKRDSCTCTASQSRSRMRDRLRRGRWRRRDHIEGADLVNGDHGIISTLRRLAQSG